MIKENFRFWVYFYIIKNIYSEYSKDNQFTCWAFSMASMLRQSWQKTLRENRPNFQDIQNWINESKTTHFFTELRHLFLMLIVPKKIHRQDIKQEAYLKASVARVIYY